MEEGDERELQLLPATHNRHSRPSSSRSLIPSSSSSSWPTPAAFSFLGSSNLDLQLSITLPSSTTTTTTKPKIKPVGTWLDKKQSNIMKEQACLETLKWQASENIRLAAMEKAYAERVREMTRREMELAQSEFARARQIWERAREDLKTAEKIINQTQNRTRRVNSTCMEITCQSCRQKFRP